MHSAFSFALNLPIHANKQLVHYFALAKYLHSHIYIHVFEYGGRVLRASEADPHVSVTEREREHPQTRSDTSTSLCGSYQTEQSPMVHLFTGRCAILLSLPTSPLQQHLHEEMASEVKGQTIQS